MLVAVWFLLHEQVAEKHLNLERVARKYYEFAYTVGKANWGECKTAVEFIRQKLDQAGIGQEMKSFIYSRKKVELPPSKLPVGANK